MRRTSINITSILFNIFIDIVAKMIEEEFPDAVRLNIVFVHDVKLAADCPRVLQKILNIESKWAKKAGMTWNTKNSWIIKNHATEGSQFYLAGIPIRLADEGEYPGVTIDRSGLADSKTRKRIAAARQMIHSLQALGVFPKRDPFGKEHSIVQIPAAIPVGILVTAHPMEKRTDERS